MSVLISLLRLLKGFERWVMLAVALGWATTMSWVALMSTSAYLISYAALHPSVAELQVAIVGVRFFGIVRGVFRYLERLVSHTITFKLLAKIRVWFYQSLEPLAPAGLSEYRSGDLLSRIVSDVETLQEFYVRVITPPLVALLSSIGVLWFFSSFDSGIAAVLFIFQFLFGICLPIVIRYLSKKPGSQLIEERSKLQTILMDEIQGIGEIIAYGRQDDYLATLQLSSKKLNKAQRQMNWLEGLQSSFLLIGVNLAVIFVLARAIHLVADGSLDGRMLAVFSLGVAASFEAILPLPGAFQNLESSLAAGKRILEITRKSPEVEDRGLEIGLVENAIVEVRNLNFAYSHESNDLILENITLNLLPGKRIALVGPSGAGKSTLINLLLRHWQFYDGEILLNGVDVRRYSPGDVRRLFALVSQDTYLFNGSIEDNIRMAKPSASLDEIKASAQQAQIHDFILTLPQGYSTWVGEMGTGLSGGQRQRVAIARALLQNAPILLLDEPTANLDTITANDVLRSIFELSGDRGLLLVTHQIELLDRVDEILVLYHGRIVERGAPEELIKLEGWYWRMLELSRQSLTVNYK